MPRQIYIPFFLLVFLLAITLLTTFTLSHPRYFYHLTYAQSDPGASVVTHHETIPNPVHDSEFRVAAACKGAASPCSWEDPNTWSTGSLPNLNTLVIIDGNVQIRDQSAVAQSIGVYPGGTLSFDPNANTRLRTADLVVFEGGTLQIGTTDTPIGNDATAEIVLRDLPFEGADSKEHLRGLLAINSIVRIHGRALSESFLRMAAEPSQGDTTLTLESSALDASWRVGDAVVVPTSRQCSSAPEACIDETEDRTITAISADGGTLTLNTPLGFAHPGARDNADTLEFLPHVINKSRNVIIRSENPNGVRGHLLFHGRVDVDMRYAALLDLGRTDIRNLGGENQKGRYPLHAHHLIGPVTPQTNGYQFTFVGNVVDFGTENVDQDRKWGIAIHASHYGLIERNVVDYASGAAIVTEDASETGNMFRKNFAVRVVGGNGERTHDADPGDGSKLGRAGSGFWFNGGGGNFFEENVAAAVAECIYCYGFKFDNVYNGELLIPNQQGADPHADPNGGSGRTVDAYTVGLNHFTRNEAYAVPNGLTVWWICTLGDFPNDDCSSTIDDFRLWHFHRWGYHGYPVNNMTLDNFTIRGDATLLSNRFINVTGMNFGDYLHRNLLIRNADIQGVQYAIDMSSNRDERGSSGPDVGITTVENSYLVAAVGINIWAPASVNQVDNLAPQTTILRNVRFGYPTGDLGGQQQAHIVMRDTSVVLDPNKMNQELRNDLWIYDYNRAPGENGDDLYVIPSYHGPTRCDDTIGECSTEITEDFSEIDDGHVYPLLDGGAPLPTPTPTATDTPIPATATATHTPVAVTATPTVTPSATPPPTNTPQPQANNFCPAYTAAPLYRERANQITVSPQDDWIATIENAAPDTEILLEDGEYLLTEYAAVINKANITVRGASGNRDAVLIRGQGYDVGSEGFMILGNNVTIADLSMTGMRNHAISVKHVPGQEPENPHIYNVHLYDIGTQHIKGSSGGIRNGVVACSSIGYTPNGSKGDYNGAIDVLNAIDWVVRDNHIYNIRGDGSGCEVDVDCGTYISAPAIYIWVDARGTIVERNHIIDSFRNIALGLGRGHDGGVIRNNFIYQTAPGDAGIELHNASNTLVAHNTVILTGEYRGAIEFREANNLTIHNNLITAPPWDRGNNNNITLGGNIDDATVADLVVPSDPHLPANSRAIGAGVVSSVTDDIDGEPRNGSWDVGADQYQGAVSTPTPTQSVNPNTPTPTPTVTATPTITPTPTNTPTNGVITGQVFEDANDNGNYDPGEPVLAGITVILVDASTVGQLTTVSTQTDATGIYRFINLPDADYQISFILPPGYVSQGDGVVRVTSSSTGNVEAPDFGVTQGAGTIYMPMIVR